MAKLEEITATVTYETHRWGDGEPYTVILDGTAKLNGDDKQQPIKLKGKTEGSAEEEEPQQYLSYRFYGRWKDYKNPRTGIEETQFHFDTFVRAEPQTRAAIITYLAMAPNIGKILGGRLYDKFQGDAVRILRERPDVAAAAVDRLSDVAAYEASLWMIQEQALEACMIDVYDLLAGRGFPKTTVKAAVKKFGNRAATVLRKQPYWIMRFRGCGFKRADALYLELGHPPARLKRQALCAWYHIARNTDGHTWMPRTVVDAGLAGAIGGASVRADDATTCASRAGILSVQRTDGPNGAMDWDGSFSWVAEGKKARNEQKLAEYICEALGEA